MRFFGFVLAGLMTAAAGSATAASFTVSASGTLENTVGPVFEDFAPTGTTFEFSVSFDVIEGSTIDASVIDNVSGDLMVSTLRGDFAADLTSGALESFFFRSDVGGIARFEFVSPDFTPLFVEGINAFGFTLISEGFDGLGGLSDFLSTDDLAFRGSFFPIVIELTRDEPNGGNTAGALVPASFSGSILVDDTTVVPLPAGMWLLLSGLGVLGGARRLRII